MLHPIRMLAVAAALAGAAVSHGAESLEIRNVRIVDVKNGTTSAPSRLRIAGGRIDSIAPMHAEAAPGDHVDGTGKYVVPGYWDMHVHVSSTELSEGWMFPLFVASGVTAVRDMAGDCWTPGCEGDAESLRRTRDRIRSGEIVGPRILSIGSDAAGGPRAASPALPEWAAPGHAAQARRLVRMARERNLDFVKVYDTIPREAYFAMMEEAAHIGLEIAGHVPKSVAMLEAVGAGQRSIEHAKHPAIDCSAFAPAFRQVFSRWADGDSDWIYTGWVGDNDGAASYDLGDYQPHVVSSFDEGRCKDVIADFAASNASYVPTLITRKFEAFADDPAFLDDPRLDFVPEAVRASWARDAGNYEVRFRDPARRNAYRSFYELGVRLTGEIHRAGVPVLVGTDSPDSYCFPGSGYHDELRELKAAGLSNADILRAATWEAARFMRMEDEFGSIEAGKTADFLLLEGDPLADVANAGRIAGIVLDGRLLGGEAIERLKGRAKDYAAR